MKKLIMVVGPTASGKTNLAINLGQHFNTKIISADSRQIYKNMPIITAQPTKDERAQVEHLLVDFLEITENYNTYKFLTEATLKIREIFQYSDFAIICGGTGLYIDSICNGIDEIPTIPQDFRQATELYYHNHSLEELVEIVKTQDPTYYIDVDKKNRRRLMRSIEIFEFTKTAYSSFLKQRKKQDHDFQIIKLAISLDKDTLHKNIDLRTDNMLKLGLIEEAKLLYPQREYNATNTIGCKEIFEFLDGKITINKAISDIKTNTKHYAKRQKTWFKRDNEIMWLQSADITKKAIELCIK